MKSESVSGDTSHKGENPREDARPSRFRSVEMLPRMASVTSMEKHIPYFARSSPNTTTLLFKGVRVCAVPKSRHSRSWTGTGR